MRGITYTIRRGGGPFRDVSVGGVHQHHYLWGIGLLAGVGAVAVRGTTFSAIPLLRRLRRNRRRLP